jgi:hypothetical protein
MPSWWAHATEEQRARHRAAVSSGQKLAWQRGRKGNYRHPKGRSASLAAQGIPPDCVRFYWIAREVLGGHNGWWPIAKIAARIKWFTGLYGTDDAAFRAWHYWIAGIHRIGQHDHMKPCHRHKLPEIDAHFEALFPSGRPPAPVRKDGYADGAT